MERMGYIVFLENRPFSYLDFIPEFEVNGTPYTVKYGTLRNYFLKLRKNGDIELDYRSKQAFYTIKGQKLGKHKLMTSNHMGGIERISSDPVVKLISSLPMQSNALHDIRLRFSSGGLWSIVSTDCRYTVDAFSKDVRLKPYRIGNLNIGTSIHKTDTVSVVVGCSYSPIVVDVPGIIRLSNALTRVEERLSRLVEDCYKMKLVEGQKGVLPLIPEHYSWIVTMWHFGVDGKKEYAGPRFSVTWEVGENALIRAYTKQMRVNNKTIVRLERQEYPNATFEDAVNEKLGQNVGL
jgi:hypothetical protein